MIDRFIINLLMLFLTVSIFKSCVDANHDKKTLEQNKDVVNESVLTAKKGRLTYVHANTLFEWTAFKTTNKVAVSGSFNEIFVENDGSANTVEDIISSTKFAIPTSSVYSGNQSRDYLISNIFFGSMIDTDTIYGKFVDVIGGKGLIAIKMNGIESKTQFTYAVHNDTLKITSSILLDNWKGEKSISALNDKCISHHTGSDGVTKTWSDVSIKISTYLKP
ncbi:MAG: hypothetical protein KAG96_02235 [Ichthyobacteriaceae bacterium]|nr:hypothetical protein [Ichthyobacteriaceae bacterium]